LLVAALSGAIYGGARLVGINEFPLVVAVLFALIIAMPLGIWLLPAATARDGRTGGIRRAPAPRTGAVAARLRGEAPPDEAPDED